MSAVTVKPTRRQRMLDELTKLQQQMVEATAEQRKYESKAATPDMIIRERQSGWTLCQLRRGNLDRKIRILRGKIAQIDRPAHDAKQQWRDDLAKRLTEQKAWRDVLSMSLLTHRAEHLSVWGNDLGNQTERIRIAERRLSDCEAGIRQLQQELAGNMG